MNTHIYIYCTCAGCIVLIVYIVISLCPTPSAVLPFPREPNLERSVVIIGVQGLSCRTLREKHSLWRFRGPERLSRVRVRVRVVLGLGLG